MPVNKTRTAFTKPVDPVVGNLIERWKITDHDGDGQEGGPTLYYDLGELYCTSPFWSSCPHRMACIGCDFSLPKSGARALMLESSAPARRYPEEVPLTPDEQAIAENDLEKIDAFIRKYLTRHRNPVECAPRGYPRSAAVISPLTPAVSPALSEIRHTGIIMNQPMTVL